MPPPMSLMSDRDFAGYGGPGQRDFGSHGELGKSRDLILSYKAGKSLEDALEAESRALDGVKVTIHGMRERIQAGVQKIHRDEQHLRREHEKLDEDREDVRAREMDIARLREELAAIQQQGCFSCCTRPQVALDVTFPP
uniref:Uncharacterized protein n=1 Tax=Zooxanthella nutricula TaxID=1333877 RepID=A0A7S2HL42_9DINO